MKAYGAVIIWARLLKDPIQVGKKKKTRGETKHQQG